MNWGGTCCHHAQSAYNFRSNTNRNSGVGAINNCSNGDNLCNTQHSPITSCQKHLSIHCVSIFLLDRFEQRMLGLASQQISLARSQTTGSKIVFLAHAAGPPASSPLRSRSTIRKAPSFSILLQHVRVCTYPSEHL